MQPSTVYISKLTLSDVNLKMWLTQTRKYYCKLPKIIAKIKLWWQDVGRGGKALPPAAAVFWTHQNSGFFSKDTEVK